MLYHIGDFVGTVPQTMVQPAPIALIWFMLRVHPNLNLKAERQLHDRGISAYVPKETRTVKAAHNRRVSRTMPIFPGALFVPDFEADITRLKRCASGIGGFVKYAGEAVRISLRVMDEIRRFEAKRNGEPEQRKFRIDQIVRIKGGPFDLWTGQIERLDSRYRLSVLIEFLGARSSLQVDEDQVEAV
jgi:transcription antitermination factor NusG